MERPVCKCSLATDERYNDGISSGHMWNDKRTMQTQRNILFDRVPREVIIWAMRKLGVKLAVEEWLVSAVMSMYAGAKTVVRTVYGNSKGKKW